MKLSGLKTAAERVSFNMTPLIDIVFLLIIFFLVVFQFIEAETLEVSVPQDCPHAQNPEQPLPPATLSVAQGDDGQIIFAVGSERLVDPDYDTLAETLTAMLNDELARLWPAEQTVTLRIDRHVPYSRAQYALAAIAGSEAANLRIAALRQSRP